MAFAYGMRFDDDSNAITVIDEENQSATTTGYINGEYIEFDSNPNSVQTVTGTLENPWGDIDYAELRDAMYAHNASAYLDINASALGFGVISSRPSATEEYIYTNGATLTGTVQNSTAFSVAWNSEGFNDGRMLAGGNIVDLSSYKDALTTTLTVIWHPLPEE